MFLEGIEKTMDSLFFSVYLEQRIFGEKYIDEKELYFYTGKRKKISFPKIRQDVWLLIVF